MKKHSKKYWKEYNEIQVLYLQMLHDYLGENTLIADIEYMKELSHFCNSPI